MAPSPVRRPRPACLSQRAPRPCYAVGVLRADSARGHTAGL